jgi:hypothetical protein
MEYYLAIKRIKRTVIQRDLEIIMFRETDQAQKDKYFIISLIHGI